MNRELPRAREKIFIAGPDPAIHAISVAGFVDGRNKAEQDAMVPGVAP
jgi:hypothetical protein